MNTYNMDKMYESYADTVERMQMWLDESERENKQLKEEIKKINSIIDKQDRDIVTLSKGNKQLKERINKAIEYIENNPLYEEKYDYDYEENSYLSGINDEIAKKDLLEILKEVE